MVGDQSKTTPKIHIEREGAERAFSDATDWLVIVPLNHLHSVAD